MGAPVLGSNMIPLRTKLDTQTTVISHRKRKRFSSSAGLLSVFFFGVRSAIADIAGEQTLCLGKGLFTGYRRHNTGFGGKGIVFFSFTAKL